MLRRHNEREMGLLFDLAYALVIFVAFAVAGAVPGALLGLAFPAADRKLLLPAVPLALAGWIWFGWTGGLYGISRLGLLLYTAVAAVGLVRGWQLGLDIGIRTRKRRFTS